VPWREECLLPDCLHEPAVHVRVADRLERGDAGPCQLDEVRFEAAAFPTTRADDLAWELLGFAVGGDDDGLAVKRVRSGSPVARIGPRSTPKSGQ
jgi:hypothetical protein